ncbi:admQ domain protein [Yersinia enterocolitica]|nr:admQ domain protein [Yersinia enterocolitica]
MNTLYKLWLACRFVANKYTLCVDIATDCIRHTPRLSLFRHAPHAVSQCGYFTVRLQ